ncbi:Phospholipase D [Drechmeria coniospora]|uniref:Phospholipase D1 n=1 Tax=Drechmeria coniospora TaxID=98403 RepID=A0A151GMX8_DRECN|nr:Phospholipase D [Drechmeria coniospora]KYK58352.1 Phospholipase D [Drechmeria coniospora]
MAMGRRRRGSVSPGTRTPPSPSVDVPPPSSTVTPTSKSGALLPPAIVTPKGRPANIVTSIDGHDRPNGAARGHETTPETTPGTADGGPPDGGQPREAQVAKSGGATPHDNVLVSPTSDPGMPESLAMVGRRNVQFASPSALEEPIPASSSHHARRGSWGGPETPGKSRGASFMSKIKALASPPHQQSFPSPDSPPLPLDGGAQSLASSPSAPRTASRVPDTLVEEHSDADADVEETADEANIPDQAAAARRNRMKRKMKRFRKGPPPTPSTPPPPSADVDAPGTHHRLLRRRASMPDTSAAHDQVVVSDGDARPRPRRGPFRRGHSYAGSLSRPPGEDPDDMDDAHGFGHRSGHLRRISVFGGGGISDGDAVTSRRAFFKSERASNFGAQKWKRVKSTLKLLRQKKEDRFDYYKSAELMAELRAGAPAVLMFASMIQRDEHGNKRIPVLLEQLKLRIQDSAPMPDDDKDRHWIFTMELEYGSGPSRMSWTVTRTIRDIYNLHFRYRFALGNEKYMPGRLDLGARPKQPKFPYSAFPYLRQARDKGESSEEDDGIASVRADDTAAEATDDGQTPSRRRKSRATLWGMRRRSTGFTDPGEGSNAEGAQAVLDLIARRQRYVEKQRRTLEKYLSEMIRWLMFRADSNRLCRFLELSALGVRLAAEGSYHGKEGYLHIQSSKGLDFRRVLTPAKVIARHSRKWFLVRQSYVVCVESPENMNIYDVYLVDAQFSLTSKRNPLKQMGGSGKQADIDLAAEAPTGMHHTLTLNTSERKVRLFSRYQAVTKQFEESINAMLRQTSWHEPKRYDSFAPVRDNVFAQWLVDGRDYMWNVSRAINMAKDVIYIHDWWLSPELYMRRPAAISQKWRLDRLLQKKAQEGVKIFVIIYRNVEAAIPIDSEYTKFSLLNLHENIFIQRSPNQFKKNQFFFAHHEKICIVDHDVAFVGGMDLCFGRWDAPQHPIVDDKPTGFETSEGPRDAEHCQLFPGKDYSNPRVQDFFRLNEPYEEMYDRSKVPRMPWHDVSMQVVGQPARDMTRHFVQRWNYLRRGRKPTRPLPFLLPPPDARLDELEALGLTGTCEVQILRSATTWSLGTNGTEHSIQNAYVQMIEESEHFVYMENQFFITSTEAYNTKIVNRIGDALVDRIIRAHENNEDWRCVIVIPLMPGFQNTVDEQEGTSVRLIVMCQYKSICRGEQSIFGRLRAAGIEPEDYIAFYSLRQWGKMSNDTLVTEQLYIHAKAIVVDDRVALIGSANINERSMLGTRDSECAAIVRDTDMIDSTMAGKPYQVGRFAHTLRLRLMREHLGLDVDAIQEEEREKELDRETFEQELDDIYHQDVASAAGSSSGRHERHEKAKRTRRSRLLSINHDVDLELSRSISEERRESLHEADMDDRVSAPSHQLDLSGYGPDHWKAAETYGVDSGRDSVIVNGHEVLVHDADAEGKGTLDSPTVHHKPTANPDNRYLEANGGEDRMPVMPPLNRRTTEDLGLPRPAQLPPLPVGDDTAIGGPPVRIDPASGRPTVWAPHPMAADIKPAAITKDCMRDPIDPGFMDEIWNRVASNNTKLYRRVFRCMPDSEVRTWNEYREYTEYGERFRASMEGKNAAGQSALKTDPGSTLKSAVAGAGIGAPGPEAIVKAAQNGAEKAAEPVEKLLLPLHDPEKVEAVVAEVQEAGDGETVVDVEAPVKNGASRTPSPPDAATPPAAPPGVSQNNVPFPALENSTSKPLDRQTTKSTDRKTTFSSPEKTTSKESKDTNGASGQTDTAKRRRRGATKGSRRGFTLEDMPSRADADELMNMTQGSLVLFPYDWLITEDTNGNWGYQVDGVAPLAI